MTDLFQRVVDFIASAPLPNECPEDPELGAWFLSPTQHLVEMLVANTAFLYLAYIAYSLYTAHPSHSILTAHKSTTASHSAQAHHRKQHSAQSASSWWSYVQVFLLALSWSVLFIHKWREDRLWFLLQPCHVLHLLLMYTLTLPPSSPRAIFLFNLYLQLLFSPFLGLVAADLSCYQQPFELANWFLQHALLLLLPLTALIPPACYPLLTGIPFFLLCFSIEVLFHGLVLSPLALWTTYNLNYVVCPPMSSPLASFGRWYRVAMTLGCAVLSLAVRYGLVEGWRWAVERGFGADEGPDVVELELEDKPDGDAMSGGKQVIMKEHTDGHAPEDDDDGGQRQANGVTRARRSRRD